MCGIAGYYGVAGDVELLTRMNDTMRHRGPDGDGVFADDRVGLAHRRLAIIDREHAAQPMATGDDRYVIVYNGEVYNYRELRAELEAEGVQFRTHSDTEVVLEAYKAWGTAAFDRFNGMWGLAIYDAQTDEVVLSRDHFGIKPLYYAETTDASGAPVVVFASEMAPLFESGLLERQPNDRIIYRFLRFRAHDDGRETFFAGVNRVLPGEAVTISGQGTARSLYTSLEAELEEMAHQPGQPYTPEVEREFRRRFTEAIRMRLVSEVPVGTALSGGMDSSSTVTIIDGLLSEHAQDTESIGTRQQSFSAVFPNERNDEERYIDAVLDEVDHRINCHKIHPTANEFADDLSEFVRVMEEPVISTAPYAQYRVMKHASEHVTVMLDGQGADETMAGYPPYFIVYFKQLRARKEYAKLARELRASADIMWRFATYAKKDTLLRKKKVPPTELMKSDFAARYSDEKWGVIQDNLKSRLIQDVFAVSLPNILRFEDKNTMRFSIEGRVPFLDKELLKYQFSLADESIIHDGWNKAILRDSTEDLLPEMITRRRNKIGFTTPEDAWFERLKDDVYAVFASDEFASRPYFDHEAVLRAYEEFVEGRNDTGSMLFWRFLNVELWLREFIDPPKDESVAPPMKQDLLPNPGKELDIAVSGGQVRRYTLQTDFVVKTDDLDNLISSRLEKFFHEVGSDEKLREELMTRPWYLFIAEKIVAMTQGRSWLLTDIKTGWWARTLSKRVAKTPYGTGLRTPQTMQLAIQETGLPRIVWAAAVGAAGKLVGRRGLFYQLAGNDVRAIDGPAELNGFPRNVSAKLPPKDPDVVSRRLSAALRDRLPQEWTRNYRGAVIIDSNDIGRNILGHDTGLPESQLEDYFRDNPIAQGRELTPLGVVFELT